VVNPHAHQVFLPCPFRLVTGLYCPFCGGLRMVHDLAHGQVIQALHDDALALPLLLFAVAAWLNVAVGAGAAGPWSRCAGLHGYGGRGRGARRLDCAAEPPVRPVRRLASLTRRTALLSGRRAPTVSSGSGA